MAHAATFDIFQFAKNLQKAGVNEGQVEAQVEFAKAQIEFIKEQTDTINDLIDGSLATKQDIKELDLKIELVRKDIASMGYKTIIATGGMVSVGVAILGFLIKLH
ncbi:conserved hypothetical protein [Gammaproteobacteria bacterium]